MNVNDWINALKSGNYVQGQRFLWNENKNTYCCLGVLCDIVDSNALENLEDQQTTDIWFITKKLDEPLAELLSRELMLQYLAALNDSGVISFRMIAKEIQAIAEGDTSRYDYYLTALDMNGVVSMVRDKWGG